MVAFLGTIVFVRAQGIQDKLCICPATEASLGPVEMNLEQSRSQAWNYFTALILSLDLIDAELNNVVSAADALEASISQYQCSNADPNCGNTQATCPAPGPCLNIQSVVPPNFAAARQNLNNSAAVLEQRLRDLEFSTTFSEIQRIANGLNQFKNCQNNPSRILLNCGEYLDFKVRSTCNFSSVFCVL